MDFGGTLTVSLPTLLALVRDLCEAIGRAGFHDIVIFNGHGGNMTALAAITDALSRAADVRISLATYFVGAQDAIAEILEDQDSLMHAGEGETSMMLAIDPRSSTSTGSPAPTAPRPRCSATPCPSTARSDSTNSRPPESPAMRGGRRPPREGELLLDACADALATSIDAD